MECAVVRTSPARIDNFLFVVGRALKAWRDAHQRYGVALAAR